MPLRRQYIGPQSLHSTTTVFGAFIAGHGRTERPRAGHTGRETQNMEKSSAKMQKLGRRLCESSHSVCMPACTHPCALFHVRTGVPRSPRGVRNADVRAVRGRTRSIYCGSNAATVLAIRPLASAPPPAQRQKITASLRSDGTRRGALCRDRRVETRVPSKRENCGVGY